MFDSIWSASHYQGLIKELISALKFDYIEEIAEGLARHFVRAIDKAGLADKLKGQIITPVPLHKKRYLERGFNQSELISAKIAELLGMKLARGALLRIKNTRQQSKLNKSERIENMREAFSATLAPAPEFVFLFDDVFTTGQTTNEAAKALKIAGVKQVHVLAIAQGR
ncbi:MAG: ComF family protein [Patescibacteria group bacterium]